MMENEQLKYNTEAEYDSAMEEIYGLMSRGEQNLSEVETEKLRVMAIAAEQYEELHFPFPPPLTITEKVEQKRFELNLSVTGLANMLGLGKAKLSQILNGKKEPDVTFLRAVYHKLGIDPGVSLDQG
ncbi:helix-turn-helix domain-containing protein [Dyadobacter linearis]|nr:helix-turn-helix domain-containing protein [Dyadobacter sp. CECT 9623]